MRGRGFALDPFIRGLEKPVVLRSSDLIWRLLCPMRTVVKVDIRNGRILKSWKGKPTNAAVSEGAKLRED